ncbi:MAG TPA: lipopolysaccharide heptosyltransferase II [Chloroflexota bacterium]|nr:lipopolysaccharide heptosyltransferase II [Chloroflexota bacterium]
MAFSLRSRLISAAGSGLGAVFPKRTPPDLAAVRKVLVIKPAAHGDILFATPTLTALRRAMPQAKITLAVSKWFVELAAGVPDVDEVMDAGAFGTPGRYGWLHIWRFAQAIRKERFDLAVVLDRSPKVALAPWLAGIPHRAGIDSLGRGFALTVRTPWDRPRHESDLMLDVAASLGITADDPHLQYVPSMEQATYADRLMQEWDLASHFPLVMVHPGGASNPGMTMPSKRWPATKFAELADALVEETGARILVVGHGADAPIARQMRLSMKHPSVDLVGQTTVGQLAALLQRCHLYVGNDSLPLHLSVAVGTPVLGIFGPTDPAINGPYNAPGTALVDEGACSQNRAFTPGPLQACPNCACIERVTVDQARYAAARLLTATAQKSTR